MTASVAAAGCAKARPVWQACVAVAACTSACCPPPEAAEWSACSTLRSPLQVLPLLPRWVGCCEVCAMVFLLDFLTAYCCAPAPLLRPAAALAAACYRPCRCACLNPHCLLSRHCRRPPHRRRCAPDQPLEGRGGRQGALGARTVQQDCGVSAGLFLRPGWLNLNQSPVCSRSHQLGKDWPGLPACSCPCAVHIRLHGPTVTCSLPTRICRANKCWDDASVSPVIRQTLLHWCACAAS